MNISEGFRQKLKNISTLVDFVAMQTERGIQTEMPAHMIWYSPVYCSLLYRCGRQLVTDQSAAFRKKGHILNC